MRFIVCERRRSRRFTARFAASGASNRALSEPNERLGAMSDQIFAVPDAAVDDLRARLQNTRWPSVVAGRGWKRGADVDYLREFVDYWRTSFDWRAQESALSRFTHERVRVSGLSLHQIHQRERRPDGVGDPIEGDPGAYVEYQRAATMKSLCRPA
jgi:hypothetical protein